MDGRGKDSSLILYSKKVYSLVPGNEGTRCYHLVRDDHHVQDGVAEAVLGVRIGAPVQEQVVDRLIGHAGCPRQRVLPEVRQPLVVRFGGRVVVLLVGG